MYQNYHRHSHYSNIILADSVATNEDYAQRAARPLNSTLSKKSLDNAAFPRLPHWKDALERYFR